MLSPASDDSIGHDLPRYRVPSTRLSEDRYLRENPDLRHGHGDENRPDGSGNYCEIVNPRRSRVLERIDIDDSGNRLNSLFRQQKLIGKPRSRYTAIGIRISQPTTREGP